MVNLNIQLKILLFQVSKGVEQGVSQLVQYHETKSHSYSSQSVLYFLAADFVHWATENVINPNSKLS
jgi:hypothetical protein